MPVHDPYTLTLADFRARTLFLALNVDGRPVMHQGLSPLHQRDRVQKTLLEAFTPFMPDRRQREDRVDLAMKTLWSHAHQACSEATPAVMVPWDLDDRWLIAFNVDVFNDAETLKPAQPWSPLSSVADYHQALHRLKLVASEGDPIRFVHNHLVETAMEQGLLTEAQDPRLDDPVYRRQQGLPAQRDAHRDAQPRGTLDRRQDMRNAVQRSAPVATLPSDGVSEVSAAPLDKEARRRAYNARMAARDRPHER